MQVTHVDVPPADYQIEQILVTVHRAVRRDSGVEAPPKQVDLDLCRKQSLSSGKLGENTANFFGQSERAL
jgi:hypothetical protein